jgi:uncharacterized OB-fold protein
VARRQRTGTVHATTVVYTKDKPPHNVALIDLDEGFRLMSRRDIDPMQVKIGMRVKVRMTPVTTSSRLIPCSLLPKGA